MFKFKNFKILLLLMLFTFAGNEAWGSDNSYKGTWFNFRASLSPTGEGKVYGDFTSKANAMNHSYENVPFRHRCDDSSGASETNDTYSKTDITLYLWAEASDGWEFVEWRDNNGNKLSTSTPCNASGNSTNESTKYGFATVPGFQSKNVCAVNCGSDDKATEGSSHLNQHQTTYSYNYNTRVDAYYVAVFNKLEKDPIVTAEPLDETLGLASFSPGDNQVGDIVTIATHPTGPKDKGYENKFIGWQHNGEYLRDDQGKIIRDNPYSFEVTEDNAGVYYAVYESGYVFHRIKNYVTQDYFVATGDNVTGTGITALPNALAQNFEMQNDARVDAGSIYEIDSYKNTDDSGRLVYNLTVQNKETKDYYELPSIYIRLNQDADKNAWNFSTTVDDGQGTRLREDEVGVQSVSVVLDDRSLWYIEPMDKDLETCENYFSLDPAKLVEVDGKYYTTLRTSWNILFNPEQMTPYIVKSVDETAGTFEMEPITGNIIPAGTPVIIETKSNSIEENRMVPTKTEAASGAVPSGNLLKHSEKYFPNQSAPVSNCKGLIKNSDGKLAFGGNALSTVNGNEAYLSVANEVTLPDEIREVTLAELLDKKYPETVCVTDLTCVYARGNVLYCKDDNKALNKSEIVAGELDYVKDNAKLQTNNWDQSNWVAVTLPSEPSSGLLDHRLTNVVGRLTNSVNPEFEAEKMPEAAGENPYTENTYITCNFSGEHQKGVLKGEEKNFFFVAPKPMEIANVEWAMWDGSKFVIPTKAAGMELDGEVLADFSMLESTPVPVESQGYHFPALIKVTVPKAINSTPHLAAESTPAWTVFPLEWSEQGTVTPINQLQDGKSVSRVVYYNMMGLSSSVPFRGVNIVVTEYSDGSKSTRKAIIR